MGSPCTTDVLIPHVNKWMRKVESRYPDSNRGPTHYECVALPTEPYRLKAAAKLMHFFCCSKYSTDFLSFSYFFLSFALFRLSRPLVLPLYNIIRCIILLFVMKVEKVVIVLKIISYFFGWKDERSYLCSRFAQKSEFLRERVL